MSKVTRVELPLGPPEPLAKSIFPTFALNVPLPAGTPAPAQAPVPAPAPAERRTTR